MIFGRKSVNAAAFIILVAAMPTLSVAQDNAETLADIRQELVFLNTEIQNLNRELSTTGGATSPTGAGNTLQRVDALEQELRRITGVVENLQFRIGNIVKDANNRLGDMQFRIIELEGGDVTNIPDIEILDAPSGDNDSTVDTGNNAQGSDVELAASEQGDFDRSVAAIEAGSFVDGLNMIDQFLLAYPGGPLTGQAHYWRAESLAGQGDWRNAARAFLESFSGSPKGVKSSRSLYRLGVSLAQLGQTEDACATLKEVEFRYPTDVVVSEANNEMTALGCS